MHHVRWTRAGRRLALPTGQLAYKGFVGQRNIELEDGSFAPYLWNATARTLRFGELEARFVGDRVEFWREGELQATTRPRLERRSAGGWRTERARVRIERLADEDDLGAWAFARIAIVLESDRVVARHVIVAGGRSRARGDTLVRAILPGEYRVVLEHDLGAEPRSRVRSYGAAGWIAANGWRVAWTKAEDLERSVHRTPRGLKIELPSVRRVAGQKRPAELFVSPDTYGPALLSAQDDDNISDSAAYSGTGVTTGAGYIDFIFVDDSDAPQYCANFRFASVDLDGRPGSIDVGTVLTCSRANGPGDGGNNRVVHFRCERSNTPATGADTANTTTGRPFLRTKLPTTSTHTYSQGTTTQTPSVQNAIDGCRLEGYSYSGGASEAISILAGANQLYGATAVSWAHLAADQNHPTTDPAELTVVFTAPGGPATITDSRHGVLRSYPRLDRGTLFGEPSNASSLVEPEFFSLATASGSGTLAATLDSLTSSATGALPVVGACAATLGTLASSATGALPIVGACSPTLGSLALAATGTGPTAIAGALSATLASLSSSAAGVLPIVGTSSSTLAAASIAATGVLPIAGVASRSLDAATLTAAGTLPIVGTSSITLEALTGAASGAANANTGTANATLGALTSAAAGVLPIAGVASVSLEAATASASGALALVGVCAATLAPLAKTGTGTLRIAGTCAPTLAAVSTTATGALPLVAACSRTLDALSVSASGVSTAITVGELATTLAPVGVSASATLPIAGAVSTTLASLTAAAAGKVAVAGTATATLGELAASASARLSVAAALAGQLGDSGLSAAGTIAVLGALSRTLADLGLVSLGSGPGETPTFPIELEPRDAIAIILSRPAVAMVTENDAVASISKARASAAITSEPAIVVVRPNRATVEVS